jgi:hypothetical protein
VIKAQFQIISESDESFFLAPYCVAEMRQKKCDRLAIRRADETVAWLNGITKIGTIIRFGSVLSPTSFSQLILIILGAGES